MPITKLNTQRIEVRCPSCNARRQVKLDALELGIDVNPNCILLPPCGCGTRESLFRTWDTMDGAPSNHHRRAVNALAQKLKVLGQVHEEQASRVSAEVNVPPDMLNLDGEVEVEVPQEG
jgi:hypothetical protein